MSKVSNTLTMLRLLESGKKYSVKELAEKIEVSPRMIKLYKEELEKCGIYIDNLESNNIVIEMNKYIKSKNSYLSLLNRCCSILRQIIK